MNLQQAVQPISTFEGFVQHRVEKDSCKMENTIHSENSYPNMVTGAGITSGNLGEGLESPLEDRLVYLTTCLIGHHVDVQVTNGSILSGIFHATNADRDFGVVLQMARVTKDASSRGQKVVSDSVSRAPSKTLIIPAHELVQVVAKDLPITSNGQSDELQGRKCKDIMLDSCISHSHHVEMERELQPWLPDEDDPQCPELENIFDSPWTGSWDQFKVNETLFGVKSTFNEDIYTTKLERVPQMREMEDEALRIAREIEGEETHDLHLAEERGCGNFDVDEETKYSSVNRGVDDSGHADEDVMLNSYDTEDSKKPAGPAWSFADVISGKSKKGFEGSQIASGYLSKDEIQSIQLGTKQEIHDFGSLTSNHNSMDAGRVQKRHIDERGNVCLGDNVNEEVQPAKTDGLQFSHDPKKDGSEKARVSSIPPKSEKKTSFGDLSEVPSEQVNVIAKLTKRHGRPGNSVSSTSNSGAATSTPSVSMLSPSSSMGSPSSEKLTLNPNAKEFKFNPKAKSFMPSQSSLRPISPVNDVSVYYPVSVPSVPHMQGMPVGTGVGPPFAGYQPYLYNQQVAGMQSHQPYFPANGPQYGQPMMFGHPRQVMNMQGYPTEMTYKR